MEPHVVQLDEADFEGVHPEDDARVGGEEVVGGARPRCVGADADPVLQGAVVSVVLLLGRVDEARKIWEVMFFLPFR